MKPHPYQMEVYTEITPNTYSKALQFCFEWFGDEAFPCANIPGAWRRSSSTTNGWTTFMFRNREDQESFIEEFLYPRSIEFRKI